MSILWYSGVVLYVILEFTSPRCVPLSRQARDRILEIISEGRISGRNLRRRLTSEGLIPGGSKNLVSFYWVMTRLEDEVNWLMYDDEPVQIGDLDCLERVYWRAW